MHGEDKAWDSLQVFVQDFRCACVVPVLSAVDFLVFLDIRFSRLHPNSSTYMRMFTGQLASQHQINVAMIERKVSKLAVFAGS